MKNVDFYLDEIKKKNGITSDYALAKYLEISKQRITGYRHGRSLFNTEMCLQVARELNLDPMEVIASMQAEREKTPKAKKFWKDTAEKISATAAALVLGTGLALSTPYDMVSAENLLNNNIHYTQWFALLVLAFIARLSLKKRNQFA